MKLATWNIRTLLDNGKRRPQRRSALIAKELTENGIVIAALQETRLSGEGHLKEQSHTFYWKGLPEGEPRVAGVAFAISNWLIPKLSELPVCISERIIMLRLSLADNCFMTIINVYAPTMTHTEEEKEMFYEQLRQITNSIPRSDKIVLLGDFNSRVGSDWKTWQPAIGKFGRGNMNSNGELLLNLCTEMDLVITNTYFQVPEKWYYTWQHPRSKHLHLPDYIITRKRDLKDVKSTRVMRGPECSTDHYMVRSICSFRFRPKMKKQPQVARKLNTTLLKDETTCRELENKISAALVTEVTEDQQADIGKYWNQMKNTVYNTTKQYLGLKRAKRADWFDESDAEIANLVAEKNAKHKAYIATNSQVSKQELQKAKRKLQRKTRQLKNNWWLNKAKELQTLADQNNSAAFYSALKEVYGPQKSGNAQLLNKENTQVLSDRSNILKRWEEHFHDLLDCESTANPGALDGLIQHPVRDDLDYLPTETELKCAINSMKTNKAPGIDGIPAEVFKHGGTLLKENLLKLIQKCWEEQTLPQDFKDAVLIPIYKNKGDRRDCGNYRGISLLSVAGKILAKILQQRLKILSESVLPESQCGFRPSRSTTDMIFSVRQIHEKAIEQQQELYIVFVDFSKAFDTVDRDLLWKVLRLFGCPERLVEMIRLFHDGMKATVCVGDEQSNNFPINHGTKQGCVLAPNLFTLFLAVLLMKMKNETSKGVYVRTRHDGKLFNLARLKAMTKTQNETITELLFADDTALVAHSAADMQEILDKFATAAGDMGLKINISKTEMLHQPSPERLNQPTHAIKLNGEPLTVVSNFKYLGSTLTVDNRLDTEINNRIKNACVSFGKLEDRLWKQKDICIATKCKVYKAAVLPALLYSAETYTLYRKHIKRLAAVQQRHLRRILRISWSDRVSTVEVLRRAGMECIEASLAGTQLRWCGHVARMETNRIPRIVLYGELQNGKRRRGGQKLRYKDVIKRHLKATDISIENWENIAKDRARWRSAIRFGKANITNKQITAMQRSHYQQHNQGNHCCIDCGKFFHTGRGLQQHKRLIH